MIVNFHEYEVYNHDYIDTRCHESLSVMLVFEFEMNNAGAVILQLSVTHRMF